MNVLVLGPNFEKLEPYIRSDDLFEWEDELKEPLAAIADFDFIISYGYRHIIKEPWLSKYKGRMINLHISLLPWNRGADPNYWSWRDNTPKGVTIHEIDGGIDTGPVLFQQSIHLDADHHTLRTSYDALQASVVALFASYWPVIRAGACGGRRLGNGTFHRKGEMPHLPKGWDTPVSEIMNGPCGSDRTGEAQQHAVAKKGSGPISWNAGSSMDTARSQGS